MFIEDEIVEDKLEISRDEIDPIILTHTVERPAETNIENTINFKMITLDREESKESLKVSTSKTRDLLKDTKYEFETIISPVYGKTGEKSASIRNSSNSNIDKTFLTILSQMTGPINEKRNIPHFVKKEPTLDEFLKDFHCIT